MAFRALYYAFSVRRKNTPLHNTHPILKMIGLILYVIIVAIANIEWLFLLILIPFIEAIVGKVVKNIILVLRGAWIALIILFIMAFILYSPIYAILLLLRLIGGGWAIAVFLATTYPSDLSQGLERMRVPANICLIPELTLRVIPFIARDTQEAIEGMILRGEVRMSKVFPRGLVKALAAVIHSALKRAEHLSEALMAKFVGYSPKRTYLKPIRITFFSVLQLAYKIILLYLVIMGISPMEIITILT